MRAICAQGTSFYHYDKHYNSQNVGYVGPKFSYAAMPDQYILSAFQRMELAAPNHPPVMAEIDLVSSHTPWAPLPRMVPWNQVGNGSIFDSMPAQGQSPAAVWRNANQVKAAYGQSIQYSLSALISFVQTFHDNNLVLVVARRPPAGHDCQRIGRQSRRADHDHRARSERARPDLVVGLAGRNAARPASSGMADGRVPQPVPHRVRFPHRRPGAQYFQRAALTIFSGVASANRAISARRRSTMVAARSEPKARVSSSSASNASVAPPSVSGSGAIPCRA